MIKILKLPPHNYKDHYVIFKDNEEIGTIRHEANDFLTCEAWWRNHNREAWGRKHKSLLDACRCLLMDFVLIYGIEVYFD